MKTLAIYGEDGAAMAELGKQADSSCRVITCATKQELLNTEADYYLSLDEIPDVDLNGKKKLLHHSPGKKLQGLRQVARFCAWNTFWQRNTWDIAVANATDEEWVTELLTLIGRKAIFVEDSIGLVSPRLLACLVNEARLAISGEICSEDDLDTAMQLGTGYPHGLLAWAKLVGYHNISGLMHALAKKDERYKVQASFT